MNIKFILITFVFLAWTVCLISDQKNQVQSFEWSAKTIRLFSKLPIQKEGRIKPLSTYAAFQLLKFNGRRKFITKEEQKISAMEWFLDSIFRPRIASDYKIFLINDSTILTSLSISYSKKRDRYSYNQLKPGLEKLEKIALPIYDKEKKIRNLYENQILHLYENLMEYHYLLKALDFARPIPTIESKFLEIVLPDTYQRKPRILIKKILGMAAMFHDGPKELKNLPEIKKKWLYDELNQLNEKIKITIAPSYLLTLFPSEDNDIKEWLSPRELLYGEYQNRNIYGFEALTALEELTDIFSDNQAPDPNLVELKTSEIYGAITYSAKLRNEYNKIELEVIYYQLDLFYYSLLLYLFSFIIIAISWIKPNSFIFKVLNPILVIFPTLMLIVGIILRCIIRERPPVSNLYETILFITAFAVTLAIILEFIDPKKIAIAIASIMGAVGMFLSYKYEIQDAQDNMGKLIAVLDSNFWLSTHVTSVTIGYASGLLAAGIAHAYILGKVFRWNSNPEYFRTITRMVYGIICFATLFSVLGTVLGGIWANDSWGRFWGWDPKENGALAIVLWNLVILHARMGGYIREYGINIMAILGGIVVSASWWGVNQLGVGLHSYGFTSGIMAALMIFWALQMFIVFLGLAAKFLEKNKLKQMD